MSEPLWVVPSAGLPVEAPTSASNNNVAIEMYEGRSYMAWRTAPTYSLLPKRTSIYKVDRQGRRVVRLKDMPSAADTSFASIVQIAPKKFLVANYTTPLINDGKMNTLRWAWIQGQVSSSYGTKIYLVTLEFP